MTTAPIVLGYYPAWPCGLEPGAINFRQFTHLAHAFASPTAEGKINGISIEAARALTGPAHAAGTKVLLSLGGGGGSTHFSAIMRDPGLANSFVDATVALVEAAGYDGLDCDWEFPENPIDAANLVELVGRYRKRLPTTLLSMAVNSSDWYGRWFNHEPLLSLFDFLNVMTYDFHGPWGDHAGHNAPLRGPAADPDGATVNCEAAMRYWQERKGFPKDKLVLGLPCYGRSFLAAQWYTPVTGKSSREYITWHTTRDLIKAGWVRVWDAEAGVPYLRKDGETELISYEDEESALAKGAWAKAQGFRGIMFWEISQDTKDGSHIIVGAARKGFGL